MQHRCLGQKKLFDTMIPRQIEIKVDLNEFADLEKWEEYKKLIGPRKEWLTSQDLEEITIPARDGVPLHAYYLPAEQPSERLVIGLHGYTSCGLSNFCSHAYYFHRMGFDCLIPDHRAHGESDGDYIGFGILDRFDCRAWIDYIDKCFDSKKRILLHGTSMDATTALMAIGAADLPQTVKAVVADCAFTSPYDIFRHILKKDYHIPAHPVMDLNDKMCRRKAGYGFRDYSTLTAVQNTHCPVFFIHGSEDKFVPTWMTEQNYQACASPKEL
ncbi:MAG: alpha/beta hydrolase [Ruminococcus sp.]|nr:alpha/beta hydrolase [Ruminococcus sp.]